MKCNLIALAACVAVIALSCSKTSDDVLSSSAGGTPCDTTNMKYAADVVPILTAHCYSCHGKSTNTVSGIVLEGYANLKAMADNGNLIGVITHAPNFPAMPQNAPKLSDCNINTIRSWINNGTQNN
jgi:cytochrome c553